MDHDVIVVGGGIVGASCAYHLAGEFDDVVVLERDGVADKATGRSAGHVATYESGALGTDGHAYSEGFYEDLAAAHDGVVIYRTPDYVLAHTGAGVDRLRELAGDNERLEFVAPSDLAGRAPVLDAPAIAGAAVFEGAAHLDPYSAAMATAAEAQDRGATVEIEGVTGLAETADGIRVETGAGTREASVVVNAAGAWSPRLAAGLGVRSPLKPRTSQIAVLDPSGPVDFPMYHCPDLGVYGRGEPNGDVLVGGGTGVEIADLDGFSTDAREEFLRTVADATPRIASSLADAELVSSWAGRCSSTPDRRSLIGETGVEGFYLCTGFNGGGVERAPYAGRLLADLVVGRPPRFDPEPVDPGRFAGDETFEIRTITTDW